MEIFYYGLRISIRNILSSVSEETANDIIRALQNAGFESLSHLQYVQEEHLMYILKPIPRRKLIKAWRKPDMIEEVRCEYERMKNENENWQDEFFGQAKDSSDSSTNPVMMENIIELLRTSICRILNSVSEETLNHIVHALKYAGFELLLDLQFVREEDLSQVLEPIQRRKLVKAWSQQGILSLFSSTSTVNHEPSTVNHKTHEDSSAAERWSPPNASSSSPNLSTFAQRQASAGSSHMDSLEPLSNQFSPYIDQAYDLSPPGSPPGVSRFTDHGPLPPEPPRGVSRFMDHDHLPHEPPRGVSRFMDHDHLPHEPARGVSRFTDHDHLPHEPACEVSRFTDYGHLPPEPARGVSRFTDYDHLPPESARGVSRFTDYDHLPTESSHGVSRFTDYDHLPPASARGVSRVTDHGPLSPAPAHRVSRVTDHDPLQPARKISRVTDYGRLSPAPTHAVSRVIDHDFVQPARKVSRVTDHGPLPPGPARGVSRFADYGPSAPGSSHGGSRLTDRDPLSHRAPPESPTEVSSLAWINSKKTSFDKLSSSESLSSKKCLELLRVYTTYKGELSSSKGMNKESVWQKISEKIGNSQCDAKECRNLIDDMKCEYERLKNLKPYDLSNEEAVFLGEAENAFENNSNPVVLPSSASDLPSPHFDTPAPTPGPASFVPPSSASDLPSPHCDTPAPTPALVSFVPPSSASDLPSLHFDTPAPAPHRSPFPELLKLHKNSKQMKKERGKWSATKRLILLQTYVKYVRELSSPNVDEQSVWRKIAEEVRQKCSIDCDAAQCYYKVQGLKSDYERIKDKKIINQHARMFVNEAREAFEAVGNSDTSSAGSTNSGPLPFRKRLALLRLYTIFKEQLSSSEGMKVESVWRNISQTIGECSVKQCSNQLHDMKCEYERMKNLKPYELSNEEKAAFLDEAENAFENIENPVVFSVQSNLKKWAMSDTDRVKLLEVYAKYKSELLLQNFDVDQQYVWAKVAREVSNRCSSFYGKIRCCYEINSFRKRFDRISGKKDYLSLEIRKTFEAT